MRLNLLSVLLLSFIYTGCAPAATPASAPQLINVYATQATQPRLPEVFECVPENVILRVADDPVTADFSIRLGEPEFLSAALYQIDTEEILVVTHRQSPVQNLTTDAVRELFAGQGDPSVTVWVYASGEDTQRIFEQSVMQGRSVTSQARLAVNPQNMSDTLNNEPNTVGILPRLWKAGDSRIVYTIPDVPVLATSREEPQGAIQEILTCLQK